MSEKIVVFGASTTVALAYDEALTVESLGGGDIRVVRLGEKAGDAPEEADIITGTKRFGPYSESTRILVRCLGSDARLTIAQMAFRNDAAAGVLPKSTASGALVASRIIDNDTNVIITGLPTAKPAVAGALWNSNGTVMVSDGQA